MVIGKGHTKTWFEPGKLADETPMKGTIRQILGGRFVIHDYTGSLAEKPFDGMAIIGFDISNSRFEMAWVNSFHMSTGIMLSQGLANDGTITVLGNYGKQQMPEPWGWRTTIEQPSTDELVINALNIVPGGEEAKATETIYKQVV